MGVQIFANSVNICKAPATTCPQNLKLLPFIVVQEHDRFVSLVLPFQHWCYKNRERCICQCRSLFACVRSVCIIRGPSLGFGEGHTVRTALKTRSQTACMLYIWRESTNVCAKTAWCSKRSSGVQHTVGVLKVPNNIIFALSGVEQRTLWGPSGTYLGSQVKRS